MIFNLFSKFEYYKSIDECPIYVWFKVQESNDLTYLLINKRKCSIKDMAVLKEALYTMTNEYIDTFGISDQYKTILELQRDIRVKEIDLLLTGEKINKTFISILKSKLKAKLEGSQRSDTSSVWIHAKKYMGGNLDMRTTTVKEFYSILNELKKEVEASHKI